MGSNTDFLVSLWERRMADAWLENETPAPALNAFITRLREHYEIYGEWPAKVKVAPRVIHGIQQDTASLEPGYTPRLWAGGPATLFDIQCEPLPIEERSGGRGLMEVR